MEKQKDHIVDANKMMTALDWFVKEIQTRLDNYGEVNFGELAKEAKEMEKEQIELAYKNGANDEFEHWMNNEERKTSIGYYKRAYKK